MASLDIPPTFAAQLWHSSKFIRVSVCVCVVCAFVCVHVCVCMHVCVCVCA